MVNVTKKLAKEIVEVSMMNEMRKRLSDIPMEDLTVEKLSDGFYRELTDDIATQMGKYGLDDDDLQQIFRRMAPKLRDMKAGKPVKQSKLSGLLLSLEQRVSTKTLETLEEVHVGKMLSRDMKNQEIKEWDKRRAMSLKGA